MNVQTAQVASFEDWFANEQKSGLIDIKFAISEQRGASVQSIQEEIVAIETLVAGGVIREFKQPYEHTADEVDAFFDTISV